MNDICYYYYVNIISINKQNLIYDALNIVWDVYFPIKCSLYHILSKKIAHVMDQVTSVQFQIILKCRNKVVILLTLGR